MRSASTAIRVMKPPGFIEISKREVSFYGVSFVDQGPIR